MSVNHIGSEGEYNSLLASSGQKLVVVDFFATWCGPCKAVAGPYETLAKKYSKGATFVKVDVDQLSSVSQSAGVTAMPTFHVYRNRSLLGQVRGADIRELESIILNNYKEVDSFTGSGSKLGQSTNEIENPFHKLFHPFQPIDNETDNDEDQTEEKECLLTLRLWDKSIIKVSFTNKTKLEEILNYVKSLPNAPKRVVLTTQFPNRVYTTQIQLAKTLGQERLNNNGQIIVKSE